MALPHWAPVTQTAKTARMWRRRCPRNGSMTWTSMTWMASTIPTPISITKNPTASAAPSNGGSLIAAVNHRLQRPVRLWPRNRAPEAVGVRKSPSRTLPSILRLLQRSAAPRSPACSLMKILTAPAHRQQASRRPRKSVSRRQFRLTAPRGRWRSAPCRRVVWWIRGKWRHLRTVTSAWATPGRTRRREFRRNWCRAAIAAAVAIRRASSSRPTWWSRWNDIGGSVSNVSTAASAGLPTMTISSCSVMTAIEGTTCIACRRLSRRPLRAPGAANSASRNSIRLNLSIQ